MSETVRRPHCRSHPRRDGVEIIDPIDSARFALFTPEPVTPTEIDPCAFRAPLDAAAAVETRSVTVPKHGSVVVRTGDGEMVADTADGGDRSLPPGAYSLEVTTAPMKLYLAVESAVDVTHADHGVELAFGGTRTLRLGARSFHEQPASTITTTGEPESVMRAVSLFASALKTTSPERTFPTLRGFPPLVEVGECFDAPDGLERPATGVRLVLPPDRSYVYPASTLAFFLGADVVPGDEPRLVAGDAVHPLPGDDFERAVHRMLKQTFTLDCVARTEGYYEVDLHERRTLESRVGLAFADLYDRPLAERVAAYLDEPWTAVEPCVPTWNLTTDVRPDAAHVETLPYLVNDLSLVRCPDRNRGSVAPTPSAVADFFREGDGDFRRSASGDLSRDAGQQVEASGPGEVFQPAPADSVEQAWVGDGYPLGANKLTLPGLRRGVEWTPSEDNRIGVRVVCNDERMREEGAVSEFYGVRDLIEFDVAIDHDLSTSELRGLLAEETDFLHYIGHVDDRGFQCSDGFLDAHSLDSVGVRAFLLNACSSYEQGEALVEKGSLGGVVTLSDVANSIATSLGRPMAKLLNCGFQLRSALSVAQEHVLTGGRYVTIGDGGVTLCQAESGVPQVARLEPRDDGAIGVSFRNYWNRTYGLGTQTVETFTDSGLRHLSTETPWKPLEREEVEKLLDVELFPVKIGPELEWSDTVRVGELQY
jgi:hypothetical protein